MQIQLRRCTSLGSLAALLLVTACVSQGELQGPPYEVVVLDRVDGSSDPGAAEASSEPAVDTRFALKRRTLTTVDDFDQLSSPTFRIRQGGTLTAESMNGDTVIAGAFVGGDSPNLRYVVEDGAAVPRDYATLLMFSAAYQFERVSVGLRAATTDNIRAALDSHGALDTMFAPTLLVRMDGLEASLQMNTNAFFFSQGWQFGLAQSSPLEQAPLAADARVIAHELGHAVFQLSFFEGDTSSCETDAATDNENDPWFEGRLEQELSVGGLNEGFADWMSFAVTGGLNPTESLEKPDDEDLGDKIRDRLLSEDNFRWSQIAKDEKDDDDKNKDEDEDGLCQGKYCLGTLFARALVASYLDAGHEASDEAARHAFSADVVSALEQARPALRELSLPDPESKVAHCETREDVSSEYDPPLLGAFLQAFLQGVPGDMKSSLCRQLIDRFEDGFPNEYRKECEP